MNNITLKIIIALLICIFYKQVNCQTLTEAERMKIGATLCNKYNYEVEHIGEKKLRIAVEDKKTNTLLVNIRRITIFYMFSAFGMMTDNQLDRRIKQLPYNKKIFDSFFKEVVNGLQDNSLDFFEYLLQSIKSKKEIERLSKKIYDCYNQNK